MNRGNILLADGGATKTEWCLLSKGNVVWRRSTSGLNPFHASLRRMYDILENELDYSVGISKVVFYGSGCTAATSSQMHSLFLKYFFDTENILVYSDLLAAAHAQCQDEAGIACILGTGSNSCLYDGKKILLNTPPLGYILGDEGSGAYLGKHFLNGIFKGWIPESIKNEFMQTFGLSYSELINKVYKESYPSKFLASLCFFLAEHKAEASLREMIIEDFILFLQRNVIPYKRSDLPVHFVGSVAWYFRDLLEIAVREMDMFIGKISQSPMKGLVEYTNKCGV